MRNRFIALIFLLVACPFSASSQDHSSNELRYEVNRVYPSISFTREELNEAKTIVNLNPYYKPSWIRTYISVEVLTRYQGSARKAVSNNDTLTQEQKDIIKKADTGADISVLVQYIPENTLTRNDIHEISFSFTVEPESQAKFADGQEELNQYLKEKAIDKISDASFEGYRLAAVKFTVDKEGQIIDTHIFWSSEDQEIDALLLGAVCTMPNWKPAEYADGTRVQQEFVLTVGNRESCVVPLLNIRLDQLTKNE